MKENKLIQQTDEQISIPCFNSFIKVKKVPCGDGVTNWTKFVTVDRNSTCVLYSPGYGAGWSTWCDRESISQLRLITDSTLIQFVVNKSFRTKFIKNMKDENLIPNFSKRNEDDNDENRYEDTEDKYEIQHAISHILKCDIGDVPYLGGFDDLKVGLISVGSKFRINEYDGSESIEILDTSKWFES